MNYLNNSQYTLKLIPKCEVYVSYCLSFLIKLPRVEKFNIGSSFKNIMFSMLENIVYLNKLSYDKIRYCNLIDSNILIQRIYIRIMYKNKYIDEKKYSTSIDMLDEIGKMIGGYVKFLKVGINAKKT